MRKIVFFLGFFFAFLSSGQAQRLINGNQIYDHPGNINPQGLASPADSMYMLVTYYNFTPDGNPMWGNLGQAVWVHKDTLIARGFFGEGQTFIEGGANVVVTGDGSEGNPYIISAAGGGAGDLDSLINLQTVPGPIGDTLVATLASGQQLKTYLPPTPTDSAYIQSVANIAELQANNYTDSQINALEILPPIYDTLTRASVTADADGNLYRLNNLGNWRFADLNGAGIDWAFESESANSSPTRIYRSDAVGEGAFSILQGTATVQDTAGTYSLTDLTDRARLITAPDGFTQYIEISQGGHIISRDTLDPKDGIYGGSGTVDGTTTATLNGLMLFNGAPRPGQFALGYVDPSGLRHGWINRDPSGYASFLGNSFETTLGWSEPLPQVNIISNTQTATIVGNEFDTTRIAGLRLKLEPQQIDSLSPAGFYLGWDSASKEIIFTPRDSLPGGGGSTQTLTRVGTDITLSGGGGTVSIADNDNDPANELQTVSLSNSGSFLSLSISDGNTSNVSLATDNTTITGNGTTATPFEVNTSVIATQTYVDERIGYATTNSLPNASPFNINLQNRFSSIYELQMLSAPSPLILTVSNPENGGVYTFHFLGVTSNDIVFPANFYYADETSIGALSLTESDFLTCYYSGANFYCK